jgi:hypothetical protein
MYEVVSVRSALHLYAKSEFWLGPNWKRLHLRSIVSGDNDSRICILRSRKMASELPTSDFADNGNNRKPGLRSKVESWIYPAMHEINAPCQVLEDDSRHLNLRININSLQQKWEQSLLLASRRTKNGQKKPQPPIHKLSRTPSRLHKPKPRKQATAKSTSSSYYGTPSST